MPGLLQIMGAWGEDTCYKRGQYTRENPARGQCVPTALLVQDLLGGDIAVCKVGRERHYFNIVSTDKARAGYVDLTGHQYEWPGAKVLAEMRHKAVVISRRRLMRVPHVRERYHILAIRAGMEPRE